MTTFPVPERFEAKRRTILRATAKRAHRYRALRAFTQAMTIAVLLVVPVFGIARVDLLLGDHIAWGVFGAPLLNAVVAVGVSIFSFYLLTFLVNLVAGRMFCGWGCPVGQLNRLADAFVAQSQLKGRALWGAVWLGFALALAGAVGLWWTSPAAFFKPAVAAAAWGGVVAVGATAVVFSKVIGWNFCKKACPIGLYYSVVQQKRPIGIQYDANFCQDEGACVRACPVGLDARDLVQLQYDIGGFAIDGLAQNNHCLRCGACVEACELVTSKQEAPALTFGRASLPILEDARPAPDPTPAYQPIEIREPVDEARVAPPLDAPAAPFPKWAWGAMAAAVLAILGGAAAVSLRSSEPTASPKQTRKTPEPTPVVEHPAEAFGAIRGVVKRGGAPVADVLVVVEAEGAPRAARRTWPVIVEGARYDRATYVVVARDRIAPENRDDTLHTFHVGSAEQTYKNVPMPTAGAAKAFAAPKPGEYRVYCDAHAEERATLIVVESGAVVATDVNGEFEISKVPVGAQKLSLFYKDGRRVDRSIEVAADETKTFTETGEE